MRKSLFILFCGFCLVVAGVGYFTLSKPKNQSVPVKPIADNDGGVEVDLSPVQSIIKKNPTAVVAEGTAFKETDEGAGYKSFPLEINSHENGRVALFCFESPSATLPASLGVRFRFDDKPITLVADTSTSRAEVRGSKNLTGSAFFKEGSLCGEIISETPAQISSVHVYPAISSTDRFPSYNADVAGTLTIPKYAVVFLP